MANYTQLKGTKKQRHSSNAGTRRRGKNKKSVAEKRRLRLLNQENLYLQEQLSD